MASQKQIEANRQNAQKSTGPRTPEGRAAVRLNSVKHGLTASTLVLPDEDAADFESLFDSLETEHSPGTPTEMMLVRQMAMASWRLRRLYEVEAGYYALRLDDLAEEIEEDYEKLSAASQLALVVKNDHRGLDNLSRLEARLERSFYKALHELQHIRAQRPAIVQKQTQSIAPPSPKIEEKRPVPIDRPLLQADSPEIHPLPPQKPDRAI